MTDKKKAHGFTNQKLLVLPKEIIDKVMEHPITKTLYITDIGFFPKAEHHFRSRDVGSSSYIFIYCAKGEGWMSFDGENKVEIPESSFFVLPPHTPHEYGAGEENPWSIYWFHISGELAEYYFESMQRNPIRLSPSSSLKLIELFDECYSQLMKGYMIRNLVYVSTTLSHLLGSILFHSHSYNSISHKQTSNYVNSSIQWMTENMDSTCTLDELAFQANVSKSHYLHLFKETTGYSPIDYFNRLKIQHASQLLDLSMLSIKEISMRVGFKDPYYFSRLFSKVMGLSPREYRKLKKG
ncbi:helix-turn-helix domain-containing protein [Evansella sp. AB-rgal1]|uniref:AraC family transcriptional regulator n=1 Tax=Evansella sp. AB-rgal1 TaxID=3242696 RepID=UPI00359CDB09